MIVIRFLLIQVCIFMPSFMFALLFIPSLNVLSRKLFSVSLDLATALNTWILMNFVTRLH